MFWLNLNDSFSLYTFPLRPLNLHLLIECVLIIQSQIQQKNSNNEINFFDWIWLTYIFWLDINDSHFLIGFELLPFVGLLWRPCCWCRCRLGVGEGLRSLAWSSSPRSQKSEENDLFEFFTNEPFNKLQKQQILRSL